MWPGCLQCACVCRHENSNPDGGPTVEMPEEATGEGRGDDSFIELAPV
jgi:hypothetical protein